MHNFRTAGKEVKIVEKEERVGEESRKGKEVEMSKRVEKLNRTAKQSQDEERVKQRKWKQTWQKGSP